MWTLFKSLLSFLKVSEFFIRSFSIYPNLNSSRAQFDRFWVARKVDKFDVNCLPDSLLKGSFGKTSVKIQKVAFFHMKIQRPFENCHNFPILKVDNVRNLKELQQHSQTKHKNRIKIRSMVDSMIWF